MKNGITLLGEPGKFTLKYGEKKLGTAVEQNGVFVLTFVPERTTADSDNILSLGPWEHRDDIDYTGDTVPREGVVPTSSTTAAAVMLTFDGQGLNDVENSREYMAAVAGWGNTTNLRTDDGIWGAEAPDETTCGETPAKRDARLLAEAEQRVADMEILDSGRLVGVEPVPAASDQESGELVLAPGEYVDVEVHVPPPNLTLYVAPAFDQIRSDGHQILLSFFANAEYYLGLELKPVNRPAPCTICPAANLLHEPFPTHFPGAEDYHLMDKVYSDILNLPADGFNGERYVITFTDASTRYYRPPTAPLGKFDQRANVLTFDAEGRAVDIEVWLDDLQLFLQCDRADGLSLFYLTSGVSPAPPTTADSTVRSHWATRDAAARLAVRRHLPTTERAHFSQYKSAQTLYDAVVAHYSSPATAALSRLFLPYLFPDLTAFPTVADLITHLRTSDTRYRAALPAEFYAKNPPPHVPHPLLHSHPAP
ncbi:unnamed protein product [Closterium sp. NIES-54]